MKIGAPSPLADLYYWIMEMGWPLFIGLTTLMFILINLLFGLLYAALPGAVANAQPWSIADGFFFSVDTLGTVGYGAMYPASRIGHMIAATEILVGMFFTATMTGLIFARFARPRNALAFSNVAVIGRFEGKPALMVRLATIRSRPLADATAQLSWLDKVALPDGRSFRRLTELPLVRNRNPMLALAWTLVHIIEDGSPMYDALVNGEDRFMLSVSVNGLDTLLASPAQGGMRYSRDDILIDHEFADIMTEIDGQMHMDLTRLHEVQPLAQAEAAA